jgi:hypothetical protein
VDGKLVTEWDLEFDLNGIEWEEGKTSYCYLLPLDGTEKFPICWPEVKDWCDRMNAFWHDNPNSTLREPDYQI